MSKTIHATSARVLSVEEMDVDALLKLAKKKAIDPTVFDENIPFFWRAQISSNELDAYFTRMAPSTLKNFAANAKEGVSFQDSHSYSQLPLGRSLTGFYSETAPEIAVVLSDFYTIRGLSLNKASYESTDDFIRAIRSGITFDVSVGFYGGLHRCNICGNDMWSWDCWHIPGVEYEVEDRDALGNVIRKQTVMAFAWIEDAQLSEVSAVYDGATPGAMILKAGMENERRRIKPDVLNLLEQRYRLKLPELSGIIIGEKTMLPTEKPEPQITPAAEPEPNATAPADPLASVRAVFAELGIEHAIDADPLDGIRRFYTELVILREQNKILSEVREVVIGDALAQGVRAHGENFNQETYRQMLMTMNVQQMRAMQEDWKRIGDERFTAGRQSVEQVTEKPKPVNSINVRAFAG